MLNTLFSLSKACSEFTRRGGREASMRDETVFGVRILDSTQIRRLIAFSSAVDLRI